LVAAAASIGCGMILGSIAGYFGGAVDMTILRLMDIMQGIPSLLLAIAISTALGGGFGVTILAMAIGGIPQSTRLLRANILRIHDEEYLEAARAINCSRPRIIFKHTIPNSIAPLIVDLTMGIGNTIMAASMLSYIGLGIRPPLPEWGAMLSAARDFIRDYPHEILFPGLCILITVLALNMLGDGLRDAMDPKLKN
jgi:peptide/nickel transport system permease protein